MKKLGVKKVLGLGLGAALLTCSALSNAAATNENPTFQVKGVKIARVLNWWDGTIFLYPEAHISNDGMSTGCLRHRVAFKKSDPNAEFYKSQALTAVATGKPVFLGLSGSCDIHGSTYHVTSMGFGDGF